MTSRRGWWPFRRGSNNGSILANAEVYRRLAIQLNFDLKKPGQGACIMLTCPDSRTVAEEATRILAAFFAEEQNENVLIVDGGVENGSLHTQFMASRSPGLLELVESSPQDVDGAVRSTGHPSVFFLPQGQCLGSPGRSLATGALSDVIDRMKSQYGYVLISAPPVMEEATSLAFPSVTDCVLLLIIDGQTRASNARACRDAIERCHARRIEPILITT